jgi:hypothetical protein
MNQDIRYEGDENKLEMMTHNNEGESGSAYLGDEICFHGVNNRKDWIGPSTQIGSFNRVGSHYALPKGNY